MRRRPRARMCAARWADLMQLPPNMVAALAAEAAEVLRPASASPLLLLCEHAGARVPAPWGGLGLPPAFLDTHYAYDPGVDGLTRVLSARLDAFAYELHSFLTLGEAPGAAAQGSATVRPLKPAAAH
mgnify:CR=1 FL=1